MKYKKIALLLVLTLTFVSFPVAAKAGPGDWSYDDTRRAGSSEFWDEHGVVGGAFATGANAVKDTLEGLFGDLGGESEDIVSFINFEGGLAPPTGEGLSETLKTGKDKETGEVSFRTFVVKTVNFILGFLGLVAFIVVVYGGFLYVTAAGNEEQSGKGKKAITYAAIGILIIIGSFAFVNTLIKSVGEDQDERTVGGGADGGGRGSGQEGTNIDQQSIYSLSANAVNTTLRDFAGAFKNLVAIKSIIKTVGGLPAPNGLSENRSYLNAVSNAMNEIKNNTNSLSKANNSARKVLEGFLAEARNYDLAGDKYEDGELKDEFEDEADWKELPTSANQDFQNAIDQLVGLTATEVGGKLGIVKSVLGTNIVNAAAAQYAGRGFQTSKDLQRAFADIDPTKTVGQLFNDAVEKIRTARAIGNEADPASQIDLFANASKSLFQLSMLIKNIEFVFVKIRTTTREGNAPLIVELNGLDSRDPTGDTIADERYEWNPEGIRAEDPNADISIESEMRKGPMGIRIPTLSISATPYAECDPPSKKRSTIVCTYNHPGTYIVSLKIKSTDESRVAEGQAFLSIKVLPSVARIGIIAKVGDREETLQKYEQDESEKWNAVVDKSEFQVTTSQAKNPGVTFDGSSSQGGDGTGIAKYEWSFGDDSGIETKAAETHRYKREGRFPLRLEITNGSGRKARKIVQVIVASIAAVVQPSTTIAEPDELIEFDGSQSKSDQGAISSYTWKLEKLSTETPGKWDDVLDNKNVLTLLSSKDAPTLRVKIKKSGNYRAQLTVADAAGTAEDIEEISVRSRKPRANFSVNFPRQAEKPNVAEFDANSSFDQDGDALLFKWIVYDNQGTEINAGADYEIESGGIEQKKIRLKFKKLGTFKIHLEVTDDLPKNLLQTDIREKDVEIKSIVEGEFDDDQKTSGKLENGIATFTFKGTVWNANRVEIDFGDEETLEQSIELSAAPDDATSQIGKFEFTHEYTNAGSYLVSLKAISDEGNGEMSFMKRIHVGGGDAPLAVIQAYVDGNEVVLPNPTQENPNPALEMIRKKAVKFDATHSLNMRGSEGGLKFSWDFGDDKRSTGGQVDHSYQDISPEDKPYEVKLTVSEESDADKIHKATFLVNVVSKKPQVNTLAMEKKTSGDITPVEVKLTAEGAVDPDGRITNYQFWYFDPNEPDRKLGVIDTQENSALVTVETAGEENEEHEYLFCVNAQDNENTTSECTTDLFQQEELPRLTVKNGPNKAPKAEFTVNKNNVRVGESVTFNSSSTDEDGQVKTYIWDIEGDGFQNNDATEQTQLTHRYDRKSPSGGYLVKLKVIDDKNAAGYSKEVPVNVEAKSDAPTADFSFQVQSNPPRRVKFFDASKADSKNGATLAKWMWDFDTSAETGCDAQPKPAHCNGDKADDVDSSDQNPVFDFPAGSQTFQVKLTVEDSDGNISEPKTALLTIIAGTAGGTGTSTPPSASKVNASLRAITGTGRTSTSEQIPGCSPASSEQCKRKTVHIPAESESEEITLFWGESLGDIISYKVDKDVYCDWDARGGPRARDDDVQNPDLTGGTCITANDRLQTANCFTAKYHRYNKTAHPSGKGRFKTMLTVEDREGNVDTDFVEVVFDGQTDPAKVIPDRCERLDSTLTGSLFKNLGTQNSILLGLGAGVIVVLAGFGMAGFLRRGRRRV